MDLYIRDTEELIPLSSIGSSRKLAELLANEYRERLKKAVIRQERIHKWAPLNEAYKRHKVQTGLNPGVWIATSTLIESIVVIRANRQIQVGVDRRKKNNGVPLTTIVKALEFGTGVIPPRPLFVPIRKELERDIPSLVESYVKEGLL